MNPEPHSLFNSRQLINCRGTLLDLSTPKVMGILNLTPDSFYDGGKFIEDKAIIRQTGKMLQEGASIIDLGAASSRPGAKTVSAKTELSRLIPVIRILKDKFPEIVLSVDTFRAKVALQCFEEGASIINDISAGDMDPDMFSTVAAVKAPYIAMHMLGKPATMQVNPTYSDVVEEVMLSLSRKVNQLRNAGIVDIIIDPGFGFGKTVEHNYQLLKSLKTFSLLGCPVLAGISRKSMICKVLKVNPDKALNGTTALNMAALMNGAAIIRVHDVKEAVETVALFNKLLHPEE